MKNRISLIKMSFIVWSVLLVSRLFFWQVIKASEMKKIAASQYGFTTNIPAERGEIKTSDNFPLVKNIGTSLIFADPKLFDGSYEQIRNLEELLESTESAERINGIKSDKSISWYPIKHFVLPEIRKKIEDLNIKGIYFNPEPSRVYLEGSSSAHITGFVGRRADGESLGYFGIEGYYNRILSGKPGKIIQESDALNRPIVIGNQNSIPPQNGQNIITSIDRTVQYYVSKGLEEGIRKFDASAGSVVVMETKTGKILAMSNYPGYNPANFQDYPQELYKNPIVSDGYEPGSTFKVIVMASALDSKAININTVCSLCSGPLVVSGKTISNHNNQYHPNSSLFDIILHSDNVGMANVGKLMGKEKLLKYLKLFGLGKNTGIDIEEEDTPVLRPDDQWRDIDLATATFGQGIALTRIQMIAAVNTIANNGVYVKPRVAVSIEDEFQSKKIPAPEGTRIISPQAASQVVQMMKNGVEKGEVRYYRNPGVSVAGKTGTAQVPIEGYYDKDKVIASFIGFSPAEDPKFTMLVTLREPKTSSWGSTTAAPLWFNIAKELNRYYKIPIKGD